MLIRSSCGSGMLPFLANVLTSMSRPTMKNGGTVVAGIVPMPPPEPGPNPAAEHKRRNQDSFMLEGMSATLDPGASASTFKITPLGTYTLMSAVAIILSIPRPILNETPYTHTVPI